MIASRNRVCNVDDWTDPRLTDTMRQILPGFVERNPDYPRGVEERKHWELAQVVLGLLDLGALPADGMILSVAAGHEDILFHLTTRVRWVFATDVYGTGRFADWEAEPTMLTNPDAYARAPYNRRRLVVEYMSAFDLRFEDGTFDAAYCLSSIEHFGGAEGALGAITEMARVTRPNGIVALTTEVVVNGAPGFSQPGLELFTPGQIEDLTRSVPGLELTDPIDFTVTPRTRASVIPLAKALVDARHDHVDYPHIVLEHEGRQFTSVVLFLRKVV